MYSTDTRNMVMIGSLQRHLEAELRVLHEAVVGQRAIPVGLSYPTLPANYIHKLNLQTLADADYLMLLIGTEYGAVSDKGVGFLHTLYAAAQVVKKPVISLVFNGQSNRSVDELDRKRLDGFLALLDPEFIYPWQDQDSLRDAAERGLENVIERFPFAGWQRAPASEDSQQSTGNGSIEMQTLRDEIAMLQTKLRDVSQAPQGKLPDLKSEWGLWKGKYQFNAFREGRLKLFDGAQFITGEELFRWLAPSLMSGVSESKVRSVVVRNIQPGVLKEAKRLWPGSHAVSDIRLLDESIDSLKISLRSLGLIQFDPKGRWMITQLGEELALSFA